MMDFTYVESLKNNAKMCVLFIERGTETVIDLWVLFLHSIKI